MAWNINVSHRGCSLFSDLSKYSGHFDCGVLTAPATKGRPTVTRTCAYAAFEIDDGLEWIGWSKKYRLVCWR